MQFHKEKEYFNDLKVRSAFLLLGQAVRVKSPGYNALQVQACLQSVWCKMYHLVGTRLVHINLPFTISIGINHLIIQNRGSGKHENSAGWWIFR